jgi:hypothetical protein
MKSILILASLSVLAGPVAAQDGRHTSVVMPQALVWKNDRAFPRGVQIAPLIGDPTKAGDTVVLRIKFPSNFMMPPHTHPYSEVVTVVSGRTGTNSGDKPERKGDLLDPGFGLGSRKSF